MPHRGTVHRPVRPLVAWRALRVLLADPERTDQVFVIIRALSGNSLERSFRRILADPVALRTLDPERSLVDTLSDLPHLRALPDGTLGREYARFMDEQGITARGLIDASVEGSGDDVQFLDPRAQRLGERLRDMHDLWHVAAGYNRDLLGEAALLAFSYAQTRNRGVGFIALVGAFQLWRYGLTEAVSVIRDGFRRGRNAAFLAAADWEALLVLPLDEVRTRLRLGTPPAYTPLFNRSAAQPA